MLKAPAFVLINKESHSQVPTLPQTPKSDEKSRVYALVSSNVDHLVDCGPDQAQPTDHNHREPQSESSGQTLPLNLGLADPSFCDVQQRGFIRASELFQSMKSGFMAKKPKRTCEKIHLGTEIPSG
jgi:hypothetical protein